jgi:hypothetical protein
LILPSKPFGFFGSIGCRAGSIRSTPRVIHTNVKNNDFEFFLKLVASYHHDLIAGPEGEVRFGSRRALPRPIESE